MKKLLVLVITLLAVFNFTGCKKNENTIYICASELPHKEILEGVVKDILKEKGYNLKVTVLDWTMQNDAVANDEYDANYFQHIPYLNTYNGKNKLIAACKVHYEKLCLYAKDINHKEILNGDKIEIVNDISNIERALNLLEENNILKINESCYVNGEFINFDTVNPNSCVTFNENYKNCSLTCIAENQLCQSLLDYDFGIIPGNTAITGLKNYQDKIVLSETDLNLIDEKANVIAIKESNINNPKILALVDALSDNKVNEYIINTYGDSVIYHYVNLIKESAN